MHTRLSGKMIIIVLSAMALLLAGLLFLPTLLKQPTQPPEPTAIEKTAMTSGQPNMAATPTQETEMKGNLMAFAKTREDAEKIASLYEITLLTYSDQIALYYTEKDPNELVKLGKKNGWPAISKNNPVTITH